MGSLYPARLLEALLHRRDPTLARTDATQWVKGLAKALPNGVDSHSLHPPMDAQRAVEELA